MQISKYSLFVKDHPHPGETLVYHTRTQALIKIDQQLGEVLDSIRHTGVTTQIQYEKELTELYRMGILVRDEADDRERLERFMEQKKWGINQSLFHATILTTYNCNFACTYCFEESTRTSSQKLDLETSDKIIGWLQRKIQKLGIRSVELNYYGGEPLLNQPVMEYISSRMKDWCGARSVRFRIAVQTNGALLTSEFVDRFLPLGLVGAQVSVDGTREVHDRQRPMRGSGKGTFDLVMENLLAVADRINLTVAAGYDKGDPDGVLALLDYMEEVGLLHKLKNFTYSPIHPTLGPAGHAEQVVSPGCMSNYEPDSLLPAQEKIKEAMKKKGMFVKSGLSVSMCPVTTGDSAVTIDTQGLIFKCNAMLGHSELAVGSIHEEEYNDRHRFFMQTEAWKKCDSDCPYVPLCNTGCRLFSMFKKGDFAAKSCERSYMDNFVPEAIKKEYDNQRALRQKTEGRPKEVLTRST